MYNLNLMLSVKVANFLAHSTNRLWVLERIVASMTTTALPSLMTMVVVVVVVEVMTMFVTNVSFCFYFMCEACM